MHLKKFIKKALRRLKASHLDIIINIFEAEILKKKRTK